MSFIYLGQRDVTARKQHRCFCCNELIPVGTVYRKRSGIEPGEGYCNMEMHPECEVATKVFNNEDWECISQGSLKRGTCEER